jgi:hypothetical protein
MWDLRRPSSACCLLSDSSHRRRLAFCGSPCRSFVGRRPDTISATESNSRLSSVDRHVQYCVDVTHHYLCKSTVRHFSRFPFAGASTTDRFRLVPSYFWEDEVSVTIGPLFSPLLSCFHCIYCLIHPTKEERKMSSARRAVRFFGTVHHRVNVFRAEEAKFRRDLFTPARFPAFLAVTSVTGLVLGFQVMDRIQDAVVGCWQFLVAGCSCTVLYVRLFSLTTNLFRRRISNIQEKEHLENFALDNPEQFQRRRPTVQRRYTMASCQPVQDLRQRSLWSAVE